MIRRFLDEHTMIPIGLAIIVIGGGTAWLTRIAVETSANASTLREISHKQELYTEHMAAIRQDIAVIRTEIIALKESKKEGKWNK